MADRGPRPSGWPPTPSRSTMCGRRWTGLSPAGGDAEIGVALTLAAVPLWFQLSLINECRARVERALQDPRCRIGPGRTSRDAALCGAWLVADVYDRLDARDRCGLGDRARARRGAGRHRLPAARALGALGRPHQQWRVSARRWSWRSGSMGLSGADRRAGGPVRRRPDARGVAALPWRPKRCPAAHRAHARRYVAPVEPLAHRPLPVRPARHRADHPGAGPLAAGIPRSGDALRREHRSSTPCPSITSSRCATRSPRRPVRLRCSPVISLRRTASPPCCSTTPGPMPSTSGSAYGRLFEGELLRQARRGRWRVAADSAAPSASLAMRSSTNTGRRF